MIVLVYMLIALVGALGWFSRASDPEANGAIKLGACLSIVAIGAYYIVIAAQSWRLMYFPEQFPHPMTCFTIGIGWFLLAPREWFILKVGRRCE